MKIVVYLCFLFISLYQPVFCQLSFDSFTDKASYEYGEEIVITARAYNHSDSAVTIIANTSGFIIPITFNGASLHRVALPLEVLYEIPAKSYYSFRFIIEPQHMGLPNADGLNQIISRAYWSDQTYTHHFSVRDTIEFNAPAYLGGELFLTYAIDSLENINTIKDSMNATVLQSDTSHSSNIISEQWQTSGNVLDSLLAWYAETGGILEIYPNRDLWAESSFVTALDEGNENTVHYQLQQNYPNPFNPKTTIGYVVRAYGHTPQQVNLSIYNMLGQKVATLVDKKQPPGHYNVQWDASRMTSGVYFYHLQSADFRQTRKMLLIR